MNVGMIGGGSWADRHLKSWRKANYPVLAIYNRTRARSERLATEFNIPDVHDDWQSIVARADIDVISISMPHNMHHAITIAAIENGNTCTARNRWQ